ncbi:MAG: 30S ribosomal protein S9 [Candidatus Hodgkinia cicadicola]
MKRNHIRLELLWNYDCRKVERKKCGLAKARKAFQFSKR